MVFSIHLLLAFIPQAQTPDPAPLNPPVIFIGETYFPSAEAPGSTVASTSFELRYKLSQTLHVGGSVRVCLGYPWQGTTLTTLRVNFFHNFQLDEPTEFDYASVEVSGNNNYELYQENSGTLWPRSFGFEVRPTNAARPLLKGQEIIFRLGDTSGGSPGYRLSEISSQFWIFVEEKSFSQDSFRRVYPLALFPRIEVDPTSTDRFEILVDSNGRPDQEFDLVIQARQNQDSYYRNSAIDRSFVGVVRLSSDPPIADLPAQISFVASDRGVKWLSFHPSATQVHRISGVAQGDVSITGESNPFLVRNAPPGGGDDFRLLWGNLHVHTAVGGHGISTPVQAYAYARDVQALDFMSLTEHCSTTLGNDFDWSDLKDYGDTESIPGEFVAYVGYEWSSKAEGHRNLVFRNAEEFQNISCISEVNTAQGLLDTMESFRVLGIPHHTAWIDNGPVVWGADLVHANQPLVEIYSWHGSSEYPNNPLPIQMSPFKNHPAGLGVYVQEALKAGYKLGFTADGDNHVGLAGSNVAFPERYSRMGLTGVYAGEFSRNGIWSALRNKRTVATTGARILGEFTIAGNTIGETFATSQDPNLQIEVYGTAPIKKITIYRNGDQAVFVEKPFLRDLKISWTDPNTVSGKSYSYYVAIIQEDGHRAWFSPIWVDRR
jgi:uncharacterized protein DUF3604